jgi:hypothetical protein
MMFDDLENFAAYHDIPVDEESISHLIEGDD